MHHHNLSDLRKNKFHKLFPNPIKLKDLLKSENMYHLNFEDLPRETLKKMIQITTITRIIG